MTANRDGKLGAVGVASLDEGDTLPARGKLRHHLPGAILGPYFYLGDKLFGVEPGFLAVRIDQNLISRLYRAGVITNSEIMTNIVSNPALAREQLKKEISDIHQSLQEYAGEEIDLTTKEPEKKFLARLKNVLNRDIVTKKETSKNFKRQQIQLNNLEKIEKLMAINEAIKREGMDQANTRPDKPVLWLTKQDYNDGKYYPPTDRLANTGAIRNVVNETQKAVTLYVYETSKSVKSDRMDENVNAILENLANDISRTMMHVQNQHLNIKRNNDGTLSFLTACQWEPRLEMLENCIYGSKKPAKYYVDVQRDPVTNKIIKGYDLEVLSAKPDKAICEPNQYFLVFDKDAVAKGNYPWTLYHSNSGGALIKTLVTFKEDGKDQVVMPALSCDPAFQAYLKNKNITGLVNNENYKTEFANFLERLPNMPFYKGPDFYKGPVPVKNEAGFYTPDKKLENIGYLAPFMVLIADNDTIGSAGQNKGRVGDNFFGIDFGHAFRGDENPLVKKMNGDFSFRASSYKNIGTLFYDTELSDRMCGMFMMYKLMGKQLRDPIFNNADKMKIKAAIKLYEEKYPDFKEKYNNIKDGSIMAILEQYKNSFIGMKDAQKDEAKKAEFDIYIHEIKKTEEFITKSMIDMMEKSKEKMYLSPAEVNLLHNLEKLTSPTSLTSDNGNVLLEHMSIAVNAPRVEWGMKKVANGEIVIEAKIADEKLRDRTMTVLRDYILMQKENGLEVPFNFRKTSDTGEKFIEIHLNEKDLAKFIKCFNEDQIKVIKPVIAGELDLTPVRVKEQVQSHLLELTEGVSIVSPGVPSPTVSLTESSRGFQRAESFDSTVSPKSYRSSSYSPRLFQYSPPNSPSPKSALRSSGSGKDISSDESDYDSREFSADKHDSYSQQLSTSDSELTEVKLQVVKHSQTPSIDSEAAKIEKENRVDYVKESRARASTIVDARKTDEVWEPPQTRVRSGWRV